MSDRKQMLIGGKWVDAISGARREIINPFDGTVIAEAAEGDRQDARAAIASARAAFDRGEWPERSGADRSELLLRLGSLIAQNRDELALLETLDTGKTLTESGWDVDDVAGLFRYYGELAAEVTDEAIESPNPDSTSRLVREPVGVCGQICPWNYPLLQASWKVAPALAAGCTVVLKPSELTPLTTLELGRLATEAGVPEGVFNTVLGPGATVGAELAESNDVDLISFTGGVETGKAIMRAAGGNVKKVALELGGKNPHIIFDDAQFDAALEAVLNGVFFHAGQICSAGARLMVHDALHDRFVDALSERMSKIELGNGLDASTQMGPLISAEHRAKVEHHVALARDEGARLILGGSRPAAQDLQGGFFFEPTLFVDCHAGMGVVQQEVFGPVITVERFQNEAEALRLGNETTYGLSAGFWTEDADRVSRLSRALRFGTVWVNDFNVYFAQAPWGGYKQSGIGRELGRAGLDEYLEIKHIYQSHKPSPLRWFGR